MLDYRNILRVSSDPHKSMRTMEQELRSSHHTIRKVLDAAEKEEAALLENQQLVGGAQVSMFLVAGVLLVLGALSVRFVKDGKKA